MTDRPTPLAPVDSAGLVMPVQPGPPPAGHYSPAVIAGGFVFLSGQLPLDEADKPHAHMAFDDQVALVLRRIDALLAAAGTSRSALVRITAYIVGVDNWPAFDLAYHAHMGDIRPARTVVPVPELHYGCSVEIDAIAAVKGLNGYRLSHGD